MTNPKITHPIAETRVRPRIETSAFLDSSRSIVTVHPYNESLHFLTDGTVLWHQGCIYAIKCNISRRKQTNRLVSLSCRSHPLHRRPCHRTLLHRPKSGVSEWLHHRPYRRTYPSASRPGA